MARCLKFLIWEVEVLYYVVKTKVLIRCTVTVQLICAFVFANMQKVDFLMIWLIPLSWRIFGQSGQIYQFEPCCDVCATKPYSCPCSSGKKNAAISNILIEETSRVFCYSYNIVFCYGLCEERLLFFFIP